MDRFNVPYPYFARAFSQEWLPKLPKEYVGSDGSQTHIQAAELRELSKHKDTIVLLSTAGRHKMKQVRAIVEAGLCNALITDHETACALVGLERQPDSDDIRPQRLAEHPRPRADDSPDRPGDW